MIRSLIDLKKKSIIILLREYILLHLISSYRRIQHTDSWNPYNTEVTNICNMIFVCQDEFCQCGTTSNSGMETEKIELERGMRIERLHFSIPVPRSFHLRYQQYCYSYSYSIAATIWNAKTRPGWRVFIYDLTQWNNGCEGARNCLLILATHISAHQLSLKTLIARW